MAAFGIVLSPCVSFAACMKLIAKRAVITTQSPDNGLSCGKDYEDPDSIYEAAKEWSKQDYDDTPNTVLFEFEKYDDVRSNVAGFGRRGFRMPVAGDIFDDRVIKIGWFTVCTPTGREMMLPVADTTDPSYDMFAGEADAESVVELMELFKKLCHENRLTDDAYVGVVFNDQ
jgi:hypothetical protein